MNPNSLDSITGRLLNDDITFDHTIYMPYHVNIIFTEFHGAIVYLSQVERLEQQYCINHFLVIDSDLNIAIGYINKFAQRTMSILPNDPSLSEDAATFRYRNMWTLVDHADRILNSLYLMIANLENAALRTNNQGLLDMCETLRLKQPRIETAIRIQIRAMRRFENIIWPTYPRYPISRYGI